MRRLVIGFIAMLIASACAVAQDDIHRVDFKNFTHLVQCISETPENVTVRNGEYSIEKQEEGYVDRFYYKVFDFSYGDLDGDGRDEAVVLGVCNTGGTGNFSEGLIYSVKRGTPVIIARIPGGDRADGGLRTTNVENGMLIVESNDTGPEGGSCCPQVIVTTKYKISGGKIVKVGKETRRDIYPKEKITFARGLSGKTFTTRILTGEGKRFVVGARAGQTMSVSVDSDKASLRLLEDADVTFGINNFMARLPRSGDYTIEVQNDSDTMLELIVNIKIR